MSKVEQQVSPDEWQARTDLAACYRLMARYGMTDMIYNHITAQVPGTEHLLINAYGYLYNEITASSLLTIDLHGNVVYAPDSAYDYGLNEAGVVIHTAVHQARHDVQCVIHSHTRAGMAVSAMKEGLLPLTQTAMRFYGRCGYHDYEGVAINLEEQARLVADLGGNPVMILRNHGLLAAGATIAEAFNAHYWLEMACRAQVDAMAGGAPLTMPSQEICENTANLYDPKTRRPFGVLEWPALLRELDRTDPSFRH
jgi:ribulose-5-phosphate 4-epimerase/fuculose-1-phosphate aldolase